MITLDGITIQMPTTHGWENPDILGVSGIGQQIVSGVWSYSLSWNLMTAYEYNILLNLWKNNLNTTVTFSLPELGSATEDYNYINYTGVINPPEFGTFYDGAYDNVKMLLTGISIL